MNSNKIVLGSVKKFMMIAVIAILSIIFFFGFLLYQSSQRQYEESVIVNVFGRQRMLTQMIAKEASTYYALQQSLDSGSYYEPKDKLLSEIKETKNNIVIARNEFSKILLSMNNGVLVYGNDKISVRSAIASSSGDIKRINDMWMKFDTAIGVVSNSTTADSETASAVIYINDNNMDLLKYSENITEDVVNDTIDSMRQKEIVYAGLVALAFLIIIGAMFNMYKYIIAPFSELFKGISEIGIGKIQNKKATPTKQDLIPVVAEINQTFKEINQLISLIENMNKNTNFEEILEYIYNSFSPFIPYTYIGIALFRNNNKILVASYGITEPSMRGKPNKLLGKQYSIKETSLEKVINSGEARIINDLEEYTANKPLKEYNKIILENGIKASITLPLKMGKEPVGVIFFSSNKKNIYNDSHIRFLKTLVNSIAISFEKNIYVNELVYSSILALAKLAESRDEDTGEHIERMKVYSRAIAQFLFDSNKYMDILSPEYINEIERFSPMHDIGKVGIRDGILLKPAKLTVDEFNEMKSHTVKGGEVLRAADENMEKMGKGLFGMGIEITEGHHEKWDGSGYPHGKRGNEIPLSARIVAIADVFDALTSKRPYKEPFSFEDSFEKIVEGSGKHFDPEIVQVFVSHKEKILHIYESFFNGHSASHRSA